MILFATTFQLPYFNHLYLLKNNSLITFFNYDSLNQQNTQLIKNNFINIYNTSPTTADASENLIKSVDSGASLSSFKNFNSLTVDLGN